MPTAEQAHQIERASMLQSGKNHKKRAKALYDFVYGEKPSFLLNPFPPEENKPELEARVADLEKQVAELKPKKSLILSPTQSEIEFFSKGTLCR